MTQTDVRSIRQLGTTWATRGLSYWVRRALLSLALLLMASLATTLNVYIGVDIWQSAHSPAARVLVVVVFAVAAVWSAAAAVHSYLPTGGASSRSSTTDSTPVRAAT
ncbi:hypothetical protein FZI85_24615 [Mycobacterium sp. CBMA293]|uniref:hypothetical protein n=1 Tax=unclassified Mycolicibacterium TaxID=2636767 RepID=UPI0012DD226B|nr:MULTISPECIES: hypothetical protein [unclassified Mycolicibacterium]MUL45589.1 hypothetical protein [Mycolicibacterium sp. CBMA 360]MUL60259.1 hypothetical protein [Mycolicibacterium sp. CBMA 335]MUL71529.1 hypothetical protein [Mycolicibacterium sp. CBMA 311]MUL73046.1 hypothetical protein [Mycolicibacterium sp. CBMA 311]MUL95979.1 hypothetical protein [Mycolicibacterium sp. CBMA 230]